MTTVAEILARLAKGGKPETETESQLLHRLAWVFDTPMNCSPNGDFNPRLRDISPDCPHCHFKRILERARKVQHIGISNFVRRQTKDSAFSYWTCSDDELLHRIEAGWEKQKPGYKDGVILVPIDPEGCFSGVVTLKSGDPLTGEYSPRRADEEPRQHVYAVNGEKLPAKNCIAVMYRRDVLDKPETNAEWELVSINASPEEDDPPIMPFTLIANHFEFDGGTATGMSDSEFVAALRKAAVYWKDKALLAPKK